MENVLVTGAYGFLGTYVVRELLDHGYHVTAFGRDPEKLALLKQENLDTVQGALCDPEAVMQACL